jgi:large subunit ribosomal protein L5
VSKETQGAEGAAKDAEGAVAKGAEGAVAKGAEAPAKAHKGSEGAPKAQKQGKGAEGASKGSKGDKAPRGEKQGKGQKGGGSEEKAKVPVVKDPPGYKPRLKVMYLETVAKDLKEEFAYKSVMQIPRLSKIVVSTGLGEAIANKKLLDSASQEIQQITGRKPVRTKAKKSIANFKVRKDMDLGVMVTLRGNVMYEFLDRLVNVAMPRIKDFRGANPNAFDGHGNYSLGVTEQIIFPEIDYDKIERVSGMNIAVVTSAKTDQEARSLLARLGMPFRK